MELESFHLENTEQLIEWIARSQEMINLLPGCFFWKASDSTYIGISREFVEFAKLGSSKAVLHRNDYDLPWGKYAEDYRAEDREILLDKTLISVVPIQINGGSEYNTLTIKKPIKNKEGKILAVSAHTYPILHEDINQVINSLVNIDCKKILQQKTSCNYKIQSTFQNLSSRETECLFYLIRGKTAKEIGVILGLSSRTVESYMESIKCKFGVSTKSELIDKAIEKGFFQIIPGLNFKRFD